MAIFFHEASGTDPQPWLAIFKQQFQNKGVYLYPDIPDPAEIEYAIVWNHPHGDLLNYPNLKAVLLLGAGTDFIERDPAMLALQPGVPLVRLLDPDVCNDMAQYACYWAMHFHRRYEDYRVLNRRREWIRYEVERASDTQVTVLGLGRIGGFIAQRIAANGFAANGWSRSQKTLDYVRCFAGDEGLEQALKQTDILINCLPLNEGTQNLLNHQRLSALPQGSYVINVSRGGIIDDRALFDLLDAEHIAGAALDTFVEEPLASDSAIWERQAAQSNVHITPHISGATYAKSAASVIVDNIRKIENGEAPFPIHTLSVD